MILAEVTSQLVRLPEMPTPALAEILERVAGELRAEAAREVTPGGPNPPGPS